MNDFEAWRCCHEAIGSLAGGACIDALIDARRALFRVVEEIDVVRQASLLERQPWTGEPKPFSPAQAEQQ